MLRLFSLGSICTCLAISGAQAAPGCAEIRFSSGGDSTEVEGEAPPDDVVCFTIRTAVGQAARIQVLDGANTIATVVGIPGAEAQQDISFTTQAREYEIWVGQLMRAVEPQAFRMLVTVQ